jgi:hypothetical protein
MARGTKSTHGIGTDQGGGPKAPRKENGAGGRGAKKNSPTKGSGPRPK